MSRPREPARLREGAIVMRRATNRVVLGASRRLGCWLALAAPARPRPRPPRRPAGTTTTWYFYTVQVGLPGRVPRPVRRGTTTRCSRRASRRAGSSRSRPTSRAITVTAGPTGPSRSSSSSQGQCAGGASEDALVKKLFPDQAKYKREEQRRFEILGGALGRAAQCDRSRQRGEAVEGSWHAHWLVAECSLVDSGMSVGTNWAGARGARRRHFASTRTRGSCRRAWRWRTARRSASYVEEGETLADVTGRLRHEAQGATRPAGRRRLGRGEARRPLRIARRFTPCCRAGACSRARSPAKRRLSRSSRPTWIPRFW